MTIEMLKRFIWEGSTYRVFFHGSASRHGFTPQHALDVLGAITHFRRNRDDPTDERRTRVALSGFDGSGRFLEIVALELRRDPPDIGEFHIIHLCTGTSRVSAFLHGTSNALPWRPHGSY